MGEGLARARTAIDSGDASGRLAKLAAVTQAVEESPA